MLVVCLQKYLVPRNIVCLVLEVHAVNACLPHLFESIRNMEIEYESWNDWNRSYQILYWTPQSKKRYNICVDPVFNYDAYLLKVYLYIYIYILIVFLELCWGGKILTFDSLLVLFVYMQERPAINPLRPWWVSSYIYNVFPSLTFQKRELSPYCSISELVIFNLCYTRWALFILRSYFVNCCLPFFFLFFLRWWIPGKSPSNGVMIHSFI